MYFKQIIFKVKDKLPTSLFTYTVLSYNNGLVNEFLKMLEI